MGFGTAGGSGAVLPGCERWPTVAYLWARTARDSQTEGRIVLKTFMICRKKKRVALLPVPDTAKKAVVQTPDRGASSTAERRAHVIEDYPILTRWGVTGTCWRIFSKGYQERRWRLEPFEKGRPSLLA
jgi:hypothetical protein